MRFSASRLQTWMTCQLQAKFKYVDGLPDQTHAKASFGSCIHAALEFYDRSRAGGTAGDLAGAKDLFRDLWQNPEKIGATPDYWPAHGRITFGGLRQKGLEVLDAYHERCRFDAAPQIIALEHRFLVPFGAHELTGVVDKLEIRRSGKGKELLRIVDHKTNSRKPVVAALALNPQFTVYDWASRQRSFWTGCVADGEDFPAIPNGEWLFETLADMPRRNIWHHLWTGQELDAGSREDVEFFRLYAACCEIEKAIEHNVFVPSISADSCGLCAYADGPCPTRIPSEEELLAQENAWI